MSVSFFIHLKHCVLLRVGVERVGQGRAHTSGPLHLLSWEWTNFTALYPRQSLRLGSSLCSNYSRDYFKTGLA